VKIVRDGKPAQVSDFRAGDRLTATIITTLPPATVTEQEVAATLAERAPDVVPAAVEIPSPPSPAPVATSGSAPAQAQTPARQLPKTAGPLPLIALAGLTSLAIAALARRRRRRLP
jgi:LPXTG-motif cell wall-anchored protein